MTDEELFGQFVKGGLGDFKPPTRSPENDDIISQFLKPLSSKADESGRIDAKDYPYNAPLETRIKAYKNIKATEGGSIPIIIDKEVENALHEENRTDLANRMPARMESLADVKQAANRLPVAIGETAQALPGKVGSAINADYKAGITLGLSGLTDLQNKNVLPSFPSSDMKTWEAGGALKTVGGGLSMLGSVVSGPIKELVEKPVTQLTGNPEIGERAGFVAGAVLPVTKAGKFAASKLPTQKAANDIVEMVGAENVPEVLSRMRNNENLSLMDVSYQAKQAAQKLVVTEGTKKEKFSNFVKERETGAKGAVEDAYTDAMGAPVNVLDKLNEIKERTREVGKTKINPAVKNATPVDLSNVISNIDSKIKPGINSVISAGEALPDLPTISRLRGIRKILTDDKSVRTNAEELHKLQSSLRVEAENLIGSASGQDRLLGHSVMKVRNQIVDAIDAASPKVKNVKGVDEGSYKKGLAEYRDEAQIDDAFKKGTEVTRNRSTVFEDRPEFWEDWIKKASSEEVSAAKEGARIAVDNQINGMKHAARRGTDIPEIEFNKQRLQMLFGKKETNELFAKLRDQRDIAKTNSDLIHNSQTAMRLAGDSRIAVPDKQSLSQGAQLGLPAYEGVGFLTTGTPGAGSALYGATAVGRKAKNMVERKLAMTKNDRLVDMMTAKGAKREELMQMLSDAIYKPKPSMLQRNLQRGTNVLQGLIAP